MNNQNRSKCGATAGADTASDGGFQHRESSLSYYPANGEDEVHRFRQKFLEFISRYTRDQDATINSSNIRGIKHYQEAPPGIFSKQMSLRPGSNCTLPSCGVETYIAQWVSNLVEGLDDELKKHVELEFKLGILMDKFATRHIKFATPSEAVVDPSYERKCTRFHSQVPNSTFHQIQTMLEGLGTSSLKEHVDREDSVGREEIFANNVRLTYDSNDTIKCAIEKTHLGNLVVVNPQSGLDLRLTLSTERPIEFEPTAGQVLHVRNKSRKSWIMNNVRVDTTSVQTGHVQTREVEVEFDSYTHYLHEQGVFRKFTDTIRFALMICWNMTT